MLIDEVVSLFVAMSYPPENVAAIFGEKVMLPLKPIVWVMLRRMPVVPLLT